MTTQAHKGYNSCYSTLEKNRNVFSTLVKIPILIKGVLTRMGLRLRVPEITLGAGSALGGGRSCGCSFFVTAEKSWSCREGRWCGGGRARRAVLGVGGEGARTLSGHPGRVSFSTRPRGAPGGPGVLRGGTPLSLNLPALCFSLLPSLPSPPFRDASKEESAHRGDRA